MENEKTVNLFEFMNLYGKICEGTNHFALAEKFFSETGLLSELSQERQEVFMEIFKLFGKNLKELHDLFLEVGKIGPDEDGFFSDKEIFNWNKLKEGYAEGFEELKTEWVEEAAQEILNPANF